MNFEQNKRPILLSAFCTLTFIGSSAAFFGYFLASLFFDKASELIVIYSSWHSVDSISPLYFTVLMAFYALSLSGAIRMWKKHKDGFFIYTFSQVFILFLPVVWMNWQSFSATNAIFTGVFIAGYGLNWKWLKS